MPPKRSSAITPHAPGNFSNRWMPSGLRMSKKRKSANPMIRIHGALVIQSGRMKANVMKIPQTSSITIQPGSSVPVSFIAFFTNGIAAKNTTIAAIKNSGQNPEWTASSAIGKATTVAARLPMVPGALGDMPEPKNVVTRVDNKSVPRHWWGTRFLPYFSLSSSRFT